MRRRPIHSPLRDEADRLAASLDDWPRRSWPNSPPNRVEPDKDNGLIRLAEPDPLRFSRGSSTSSGRRRWRPPKPGQARPGAKPATHRHVPVGPYRLTVIPSIRGRAAGQIAIQGMTNKQIELTTPTVRTKGSASKPLVAVWVYADNSLVIAHLDFMNTDRYVFWHAPRGHQLNFDDPADLNHELFTLGHGDPRSARLRGIPATTNSGPLKNRRARDGPPRNRFTPRRLLRHNPK